MKDVSIGVDFGTSVVKATALDLKTGARLQISRTYGDRGEQSSPDGWSAMLHRILSQLIDDLGSTVSVQSLAVTAMVPNVALVTNEGATLGSLLFCDDDAYLLERELDAQLDSAPWANEVLSKILFLTRNNRIKEFRWYTTHNWLVKDLTGAFVIDSVTAGECGTMISTLGRWSSEMIEHFRLSSESIPEIVSPLSLVGTVRDSYPVAAVRGVPVAAGTSDTIATALGAGWEEKPDSLLVYYGTFNCAARIAPTRSEIITGAVARNPFEWILSIPRAGTQLVHLAGLLGEGELAADRLSCLDAFASTSPPGSNGVVFLHADNITDTTVSSRPAASIRNLQPHHTRGDLSRSALEGFAFLLRWSLQKAGLDGTSFSSIVAAGGGARSPLWRQIVSDVCGVDQRYRPAADRGLGSAMLAAAALDLTSLVPLDAVLQSETEITHPSTNTSYDDAYEHYMSFWPSGLR